MSGPVDVLAVMECAAETLVRMKGAEVNAALVNVQREALNEARAAVAELIEAATCVDAIADHASFVSDECCCGSRMDAHDMGSGHAPVDSGHYYGGPALDRLNAALARVQGVSA